MYNAFIEIDVLPVFRVSVPLERLKATILARWWGQALLQTQFGFTFLHVHLNCRLKSDLRHQNRVVKVLTCLKRWPIQPCTRRGVEGGVCVTTAFYQRHGARLS